MNHTTTCPTCKATLYHLEGKKCDKDKCPNALIDQIEPDNSWVPSFLVVNEHSGIPQTIKTK